SDWERFGWPSDSWFRSTPSVEADGLQERLKGGFLFLDEVGGPTQFEEPRLAAVRDNSGEGALPLRPPLLRAGQINSVARDAGHRGWSQVFLHFLFADFLQTDLAAPALDILEKAAGGTAQGRDRKLCGLLPVADLEGGNTERHLLVRLLPAFRQRIRGLRGNHRVGFLAGVLRL